MKIKSTKAATIIICLSVLFLSCDNREDKKSNVVNTKSIKGPEIGLEGIYNKADNEIPTLKSLKGKIVVLDFWAIWCAPCVAAFPKNNDLYNKYNENRIYSNLEEINLINSYNIINNRNIIFIISSFFFKFS